MRKKFFSTIAWVLFLLTILPLAGYAEVPEQINYQGYLTDLDGNPVPDGDVEMKFAIYDQLTFGTELWNETQTTVPVANGVYNVLLGQDTPLSPKMFANYWELFLEVEVEGELLIPRQSLTSTPFAMKAADADTLTGYEAGDFVSHGEANSITSGMIQNSTITADDLRSDSVGASEIAANAVGASEIATGAVGSSEIADGSVTAADLAANSVYASEIAANAVGTSEIATGAVGTSEIADGSVTAADLAANSVYASEIATGAVTSSEVLNNSLTSADLADNSVGSSEIANGSIRDYDIYWSLIHTGNDSNGGLMGMINTNNGSTGNYPAGISGAADGTPASGNRVIGVMGLAPKLGSGAPVSSFPTGKIGVAGATDTGYGVVGVSTNGHGIYGLSDGLDGVRGYSTGGSVADNGVYGNTNSTSTSDAGVKGVSTDSACGVYGSSTDGYGVRAYSGTGDALYAFSSASDEHAGYFTTSGGTGLNGASVYAHNSNAAGIALWAYNSSGTNIDTAGVFSNDGTGYLIKGFGGDGGEHEFAVLNDGTIELFNGAHTKTVMIDPSENGTSDGCQITLYNASGDATIELDGSYGGDGRITTQELQITGGSDLSEQFDIEDILGSIKPGMVVSIDEKRPGKLKISGCAYDNRVAGIISGAGGIKPGMMMGQRDSEADGAYPVALTGRVYCWADASKGRIQPGDLLTTSDIPGHAMKVTDHSKALGAIIGKAMTSLQEDKGLVLTLVSLQ